LKEGAHHAQYLSQRPANSRLAAATA
jgi:hypothetical protein